MRKPLLLLCCLLWLGISQAAPLLHYRWIGQDGDPWSPQHAAKQLQMLPPDDAPLPAVAGKHTYWALVDVSMPEAGSWVLQAGEWGLVQLYALPKEGVSPRILGQSGRLLPLSSRSFQTYHPHFSLPLSAGKHRFLLRAQGGKRIFARPPVAIHLQALGDYERQQRELYYGQGLFIGMLLIMALYHSLTYLLVRDKSHLYYVLSLLGVGFYQCFYYGMGMSYLWPEAPLLDIHLFGIIVPLTVIFRLRFTAAFLHTRQLLPFWDRPLRLLPWAYALAIAWSLWCLLSGWDGLHLLAHYIGLLGMIAVATMLLAGVAAMRRPEGDWRQAGGLFVGANAIFFLGNLLFILQEVLLLPATLLTRYALQLGIVAQAVLFSLGLVLRYNQMRRDIAQQQLEKVMLGELNGIKDRLFSIIAHDLKSPLITLDAYFNLVLQHQRRLSAQDLQRLAQDTNRSVKNLYHLLENLLAWSRTQMQLVGCRREPLALSELAQRNLDLVAPLAQHKGVLLHQEVAPGLMALGDPGMVDFVLRNLLHNAVKFTERGGQVLLSAQQDGQSVSISVTDQGVGMSEEVRQKVWASKGDFSTRGTQQEKGTGLGLLLCREFLELHGTTLELHTQEGKGSVFAFSLPHNQHAYAPLGQDAMAM